MLWILNTGAQWHMLPQSYPNYKTVRRRFQQWFREEVLRKVLTDLANTLRDDGASSMGPSASSMPPSHRRKPPAGKLDRRGAVKA